MSHGAWVTLTGLLFLGAAGVMTVVFRILGPTYHTRISASWLHRGVVFAMAAFFVVRGATLIWPGRLVRVDHMSPLLPAGALVALVMSLLILDLVQRERSPPPWSVMVMRLLAVLGRDKWMVEAGMHLPPAAMLDRPAMETPPGWNRWIFVGAAVFVLIGVGLTVMVNGGG
ncbi:hypothetical protein ASG17_07495 [Brevundimonas sp. Leaf363]|uniref:hypothetical protein n=1 Tax=Brevundimonas sp. Leaf363 TaxID=1736353 RepID=UPI0006F8363D|nr:hypothetical protein [Brevundimonas sp. Leaf363]KQS55885.1 hypothetical protein ASG17_07495 [Brevundimonas sp. Leaf363]